MHSVRVYRALVIWALCVGSWCAAGRAQPQDSAATGSPRQQLAFADQLFEHEEYDLCVLEYRRFLFSHPADSSADTARYKLGLCYMALERLEKAQGVFGQLIDLSEDRELVEAALFSSGTCYRRQGEAEAARDRYRGIAREFREGELADDAQLMLGLTYVDDRSWRDAATEFRTLACEFGQSPLAPVAERLAAESAKGLDLPHRSAMASGMLSAVLPGAGQTWCGRPADGFFSLLFTGAFSALAVQSYRNDRESSAYLLGFLGLSFYMGNIYGAVNSAEEFTARHIDRFQAGLRAEAAAALR